MDTFWLAQAIGVAGLAAIVYSYLGTTRGQILDRQIASSALFIAHFSLLSAWTGALTHAVVIVRNWVFARRDTEAWAKHLAWVFLFCVLSIGVALFSWQGPISLFPMVSVLIGIYARWQEKASEIRVYGLIGCLLWLPYTIAVNSYAGTVSQLVIAAAILYGMFRHDRGAAKTALTIPG
ncbi:MAG: YgjV family protein [Patescibacteria group bacterium]